MSYVVLAASVLAPLWAAVSSHVAQATCLRYEPDTVAVTGTLVRKTFPGPPNYESVQGGDAPETGFYLELNPPACTVASRDSMDTDDTTERDVRLIQLVLDAGGYARLRPLLGRSVTLRGSLFHSFTGHHHATLLLRDVKGP